MKIISSTHREVLLCDKYLHLSPKDITFKLNYNKRMPSKCQLHQNKDVLLWNWCTGYQFYFLINDGWILMGLCLSRAHVAHAAGTEKA